MCATSRSLRKVIQIEKRMRCGSHALLLARFVHYRRPFTDYFIARDSKKFNRPMRPIADELRQLFQRLAGKHPGAREYDHAGHPLGACVIPSGHPGSHIHAVGCRLTTDYPDRGENSRSFRVIYRA
jgi:hypothetical protein